MSILEWYHHKAEQCVGMAANATSASERSRLKEEALLWREIGADVLSQERREARPHRRD
jgi:hypothetical protein